MNNTFSKISNISVSSINIIYNNVLPFKTLYNEIQENLSITMNDNNTRPILSNFIQ